MNTKEDEVIQLARDLDPAHDSVFFRETFGSLSKLLVLIAVGSTNGAKRKNDRGLSF